MPQTREHILLCR
jgi:elongation factor Tu